MTVMRRTPTWWLAVVGMLALPVGADENGAPGQVPGESAGADETGREESISAEEILANPLGEEDYVESVRCISPAKLRRVEIVSSRVLVFHGRRDESWLNVLPNRCLGLEPDMALRIEKHGMRYCARDRFRGVPQFGADVVSMPCTLGEFHSVDPENLSAIRDALEARDRTTTVSRTTEGGDQAEQSGRPTGH